MADENKKERQARGQYEQLKRDASGIFDDIPQSFEELSKQMKGDFEKINEYIRKTRRELDAMKTDFIGMSKIFRDQVNEYRNGNVALKDSVKATNKLKEISDKLKYDQLEITELGEKDLKRIVEQIKKEQEQLETAILSGKLKGKDLENAIKNLEYSQLMLDGAEDRLGLEKQITKQMGLGGAAIKGLSKALDKLGISGVLSIDEISKKMRDAAKEGKNKFEVLGVGMKEAFKSVGEALKDPLTIIAGIYKAMEGIVKSAVAYQSKVFEVGKTLGMSVTQTERIFNNFKEIAWQNSQLAMTGKQISESYAKINDHLGIMGPQNAEFLTFATGVERRLGLTADAMQNVYLYAASTGKSVKETYGNLVATTKINGMRLGFQMTEKQIMQSISKLSATIFNNFKGNVKQMALAVQTATKFGTTLDQMNTAGMSLLNFEESIAKEFEAQLLTGKNINLARARQAALTKDTAGLMREITTQLGTQAQWNNMNVIQQQSLAEAFGLSKEAVDEMYYKQRLIAELGKQANADAATQYNFLLEKYKTHEKVVEVMGQQAAQDALAASVQDKMAATMERIRDAIGQVTALLIPALDKFANFVSEAGNLKKIFYAIAAISGVLVGRAIQLSMEKSKQIATQIQLSKLSLEENIMMNKNNILLMRKQRIISQTTAQRMLDNQAARIGAITDATGAGAKMAGAYAYLGPIAGAMAMSLISMLLMNLPGGSVTGGGSSIAPPIADMSPASPAAQTAAATQQSTGNAAPANQTPMYITFQSQVVDTGAAASGRLDRGIYFDMTKITSPQ